jgi:hypothetical protein
MTDTVHHPGGDRIMRGYAGPGNNCNKPEFAESRFCKAIQVEVLVTAWGEGPWTYHS